MAGRRLVARGIHVPRRRAGRGEAERVVDRPGGDLVVAGEAGEDRQAGGVGRGPAGRSQVIRAQVEDRARARASSAHRRRADRRRTARSRCTCRGRRRSRAGRRSSCTRPRSGRPRGSGYGPLSDSDAYWKVTGTLRVLEPTTAYGIPIGSPSYSPDPKSGWTGSFRPMLRDQRGRVLGDRQPVDPLVPRVVRREHRAVRRARERVGGHQRGHRDRAIAAISDRHGEGERRSGARLRRLRRCRAGVTPNTASSTSPR